MQNSDKNVSLRQWKTFLDDYPWWSWVIMTIRESSYIIIVHHDTSWWFQNHHFPSYSIIFHHDEYFYHHDASWRSVMTSWWQSSFSSWWIKLGHIFHHDDYMMSYDGKWWNKFSKNHHDETNEKKNSSRWIILKTFHHDGLD